jgi:hypothetical protein
VCSSDLGRGTTTDSTGLIGEIQSPTDLVYDVNEDYLYITDLNGGGLIRKLAVTEAAVTGTFDALYGVKTVFEGYLNLFISIILIWNGKKYYFNIFSGINCNFCEYLAISDSDSGYLYISSQSSNIKRGLLSSELNTAYKGEIISGNVSIV